VLPGLVELGLVERREVPPSALFRLVTENIAARFVRELARARQAVLDELGRMAAELSPSPVSVIVFGSFARGEADSRSDIDVVVVRRASVPEDHEGWTAAVEQWRSDARRLTGNPVEVIEVDESEIGPLLRGRRALWQDVARDGTVVFGHDLAVLKARQSA
jgi:predicted nucleotidyltransferase